LHVNPGHLLFNMLALYSFGGTIAYYLGEMHFLGLYALALVLGNLLPLFVHRHEMEYTAVGASGAISGVVFASIVMFPTSSIQLFMIPIPIPAWLFGIIYIIISIYGMRTRFGNIGHDAHFAGAIAGVLYTIMVFPFILKRNLIIILAILIPSVIFLFVLSGKLDIDSIKKRLKELFSNAQK